MPAGRDVAPPAHGAAEGREPATSPTVFSLPHHLMERSASRSSIPASPDEVPMQSPGRERAASVSFKRRAPRDPLGTVRSWLSGGRDRASVLENPHLRHLREATEGWEHPARYTNASHVTVPTMLATPESTPIPLLPYTVLCLLIFGEFCSAGVAGPFLFFMLDDFRVGDESQVGFWAGILAAVFFFAQFLTSLLWASAAEKHGRRLVLQVSLVGSTVSLAAFGLSRNLTSALFFRLAQGFFNGAVGVAKGAVRDLTDETNESRAYAQMGFCWGMGGIIGPILGGLLEHPAQKYAWVFGSSAFLHRYPYALPCFVAASFTALGALLSLFLEPHAGPKVVQLPEDDDEAHSALEGDGWRSPSIATPNEDDDEANEEMSIYSVPHSTTRGRRSTPHGELGRNPSNTGSVYGASPSLRGMSNDPRGRASSSYFAPSLRRSGRTPSVGTGRPVSFFAPSVADDLDMSESLRRESNMSLIERFVLANDDALLSVTDLWVAAATHGEEAQENADSTLRPQYHDDAESVAEDGRMSPYSEAPPLFGTSFHASEREAGRNDHGYLPPAHFQRMHRTQSQASHVSGKASVPETAPAEAEAEAELPAVLPSLWALIPVVIVVHYGILSFHSATFDQVFLAFLVTPEPSGGLGLNAGHYAVLIASMAVCQLYFQFRLYPNLGPPNGPLSHLAMFQLGVMLYLPCYLLFPFLRTFLLPNTDVLVMLAMIAFATLRWLANVVSFTAIMVLLNAWTPPHLVPLANGLAQTVSSAARCIGPIVGGLVWAKSIQGGPTAHPWPFNYFLGFVFVGLVALFAGLQARWLKDR